MRVLASGRRCVFVQSLLTISATCLPVRLNLMICCTISAWTSVGKSQYRTQTGIHQVPWRSANSMASSDSASSDLIMPETGPYRYRPLRPAQHRYIRAFPSDQFQRLPVEIIVTLDNRESRSRVRSGATVQLAVPSQWHSIRCGRYFLSLDGKPRTVQPER